MNNLANFLQAISFSAKKHRYQTRKGVDGEPYINHPSRLRIFLQILVK
jgi:(p)ppGpp synthase/HD superfamily hydrolase